MSTKFGFPIEGNENISHEVSWMSVRGTPAPLLVHPTESRTTIVIHHAENSNFGTNYGTQTMINTRNTADLRSLEVLPRHPDVSGRRSEYMVNSRDQELQFVHNWVHTSSDLALTIHGAAGIGKSTFAHRLGEELRLKNRLAASVFMSYVPTDWGPETIIRLIAGELGRTHPDSIPSLADAVENWGGPSLTLQQLFEKYVVLPLQDLHLSHPLIVLMDAFDEWSTHISFLKALVHVEPHRRLVKFVILSRNEFRACDLKGVSFSTFLFPPASTAVIRRFLAVHLASIDWEGVEEPEDEHIDELANMANGVFVWAWTVYSTIEDNYADAAPMQVLQEILRSKRTVGDTAQLAQLYHGAIMRSFPKATQRTQVLKYLQAIFVLADPLPISGFSYLIQMPQRTVKDIRSGLHALQLREPDDSSTTVYPANGLFHSSVKEYFQSDATPDEFAFRVSLSSSHEMMALSCLALLPRLFDRSKNAFLQPHAETALGYIVKNWPLHATHAISSAVSDENWEKTQLCLDIRQLSFEVLLEWGRHLLQSILKRKHLLECPPQGSVGRLMRSVFNALRDANADADLKVAKLSIACLEIAVHLRPDSVPNWNYLGRAYDRLAELTLSPETCERAVATHRHALQVLAASQARVNEAEIKEGLACSLRTAFRSHRGQMGGFQQLEESISLHKECLLLRPKGHRQRPRSMKNLGSALYERFRITRAPEDLEEVIELDRRSLELCPDGHPRHSISLHTLSNSLRERFKITEDIQDLTEAIQLEQKVLELLPKGHPARPPSLHNLAAAFLQRSRSTNFASDVDTAILLEKEALAFLPKGQPSYLLSLNNLAVSLRHRYKIANAIEDMDEAVRLHREELSFRPEDHPCRSDSLNNLALSLRQHYHASHAIEELEESIKLDREAIKLRPEGHSDRYGSLWGLAIGLHLLFKHRNDVEALREAVSLNSEALGLCPENQPGHRKELSRHASTYADDVAGLSTPPPTSGSE